MPRISKSSKATEFKLFAPQAKKVYVAGSFNNWSMTSLPAKKDSKGNWSLKMSLKPGRYEYKFIIDGTWVNDPKCSQFSWNNLGSQNSLIDIK